MVSPVAAQQRGPQAPPDWERWIALPGVADVVGPRPDGDMVAAAGGGLFTVAPDGATSPFSDYSTDPGPGSYIAMSPGLEVAAGPTCRFEAGDVFALDGSGSPLGVVQVTVDGRSGRFVDLPGVERLTGIAFDTTGRFGNRLLVAGRRQGRTVVFSIDCRGRVKVLTDSAPATEGGMAVAPQIFGAHGGDLIGADEVSGDIVFIRFDGSYGVLAASGLPAGPGIGVSSIGFVPPDYLQRGGVVYVSGRAAPGPPVADDAIWRLAEGPLRQVGIDNNDLIAVAEADGRTVVVRCRVESCLVLPLGQAPGARVGGHVTVVPGPPPKRAFGGYDPVGTVAFVAITGLVVAGGVVLFLVHRRKAQAPAA